MIRAVPIGVESVAAYSQHCIDQFAAQKVEDVPVTPFFFPEWTVQILNQGERDLIFRLLIYLDSVVTGHTVQKHIVHPLEGHGWIGRGDRMGRAGW